MASSDRLPTLWEIDMFLVNLDFAVEVVYNSPCRKIYSRTSKGWTWQRQKGEFIQESQGTLCSGSNGMILDFTTSIDLHSSMPKSFWQEMARAGQCEYYEPGPEGEPFVCYVEDRHYKLRAKL